MDDTNKFTPSVPKTFLLLLAGIVWEGVGLMLMILAFSWLAKVDSLLFYIHSGAGVLFALLIHHFGFLKIVDKNLTRILKMKGKKCLFSFFPKKSYMLIFIMISFGAILRHSMVPKKYLAILYIGIGLALILSSIRYLRFFYREVKNFKRST